MENNDFLFIYDKKLKLVWFYLFLYLKKILYIYDLDSLRFRDCVYFCLYIWICVVNENLYFMILIYRVVLYYLIELY